MTLSRSCEIAATIIHAIIIWAKELCFTSSGNHLCQELIEKGEWADKKNFMDEIKCVILENAVLLLSTEKG